VAFVEKVYDDGSFLVSETNYRGNPNYTFRKISSIYLVFISFYCSIFELLFIFIIQKVIRRVPTSIYYKVKNEAGQKLNFRRK